MPRRVEFDTSLSEETREEQLDNAVHRGWAGVPWDSEEAGELSVLGNGNWEHLSRTLTLGIAGRTFYLVCQDTTRAGFRVWKAPPALSVEDIYKLPMEAFFGTDTNGIEDFVRVREFGLEADFNYLARVYGQKSGNRRSWLRRHLPRVYNTWQKVKRRFGRH